MRKSLAAVVAASAAVSGCHVAQGDDGTLASRTYQVGNFQQIEVAGPYNVQVRTGSNPGVTANGPAKLLDRTVVEVEGGKLVIRSERQRGWLHFGSSHGSANFTVTVPQLKGATIAGSGGILVDHVTGDEFTGTIAGSGGLELASTDVQALKLTIGGSGGVKTGTGKAKSAEYEIAGSGGIDAAGISAEQAKVSIAGSGSVKATATATAEVSIMGSGNVTVTGGAKCSVSKEGSGNVHCS